MLIARKGAKTTALLRIVKSPWASALVNHHLMGGMKFETSFGFLWKVETLSGHARRSSWPPRIVLWWETRGMVRRGGRSVLDNTATTVKQGFFFKVIRSAVHWAGRLQ